MRPALALALDRARLGVPALVLLLGCAPVAAPARVVPPIAAPSGPILIEGAQVVFEDTRDAGVDCRGSEGLGGACFYRVGDGLLAPGYLRNPERVITLGTGGHAESRLGPLRFAVGEVAFTSDRGSWPRIWGRFPDDYFAEAWSATTRRHRLVRVRGAVASDEGEARRVLVIRPWTEGRTLGLIKDPSGWKHVVWDAAGRHDTPIPRYAAQASLPDSTVIEGEKGDACSDEELVPWDATVLPTGELIVLGRACSTDPAQQHEHLVLDRWSADGVTHAVEPLPTSHRPRWASLCSSTSSDLHVVIGNFEERIPETVGRGAVVATRGAEGWSLSPPLADPADSVDQRPYACAISADGSTWLNVTHDKRSLEESHRHDGTDFHSAALVRLPRGGQWSRVALPAPWLGAKVIGTLPDGSLWLSAHRNWYVTGLLRLGEGAAPPVFGFGGMHPIPEPAGVLVAAVGPPPVRADPPRPIDPCAHPFVRIYTLDDSTLDTYEFPSTRAAIEGKPATAGARFILAVERGQRVFGAIVLSQNQAERLVSLLTTALPGTFPHVECAAPPIQRELEFRPPP
ncbi:MAG: hypothetical protein ABJE95_35035 [Byssovorax sp.]